MREKTTADDMKGKKAKTKHNMHKAHNNTRERAGRDRKEAKAKGTRPATQASRGRFRGSVLTCADAGAGRTTPAAIAVVVEVVVVAGGGGGGRAGGRAPALGLLFLYQGILSARILSASHPHACT